MWVLTIACSGSGDSEDSIMQAQAGGTSGAAGVGGSSGAGGSETSGQAGVSGSGDGATSGGGGKAGNSGVAGTSNAGASSGAGGAAGAGGSSSGGNGGAGGASGQMGGSGGASAGNAGTSGVAGASGVGGAAGTLTGGAGGAAGTLACPPDGAAGVSGGGINNDQCPGVCRNLPTTTSGGFNIGGDQYISQGCPLAGADDVYMLIPDASGTLNVTVDVANVSAVSIYLRSACGDATSEIACKTEVGGVASLSAPVTVNVPVWLIIDKQVAGFPVPESVTASVAPN